MRDVAGADEDRRSRHHTAVNQLHAGQPIGLDHQSRDLAGHNLHTPSLQLDPFGR